MQTKILQARKGLSLSQQEFADSLGASLRAVQFWESGTHEPRPQTLRKISELSGRPIAWFFDEVAA